MTLLSDTVALAECDILGIRVSPRAGPGTVPAPEVQLSRSVYTQHHSIKDTGHTKGLVLYLIYFSVCFNSLIEGKKGRKQDGREGKRRRRREAVNEGGREEGREI